MTLDDLATDLACEPAEFDAEEFWDEETKERRFSVHGGMWEVALAMGGREGPVTRAIGRALRANPGYGAPPFFFLPFFLVVSWQLTPQACSVVSDGAQPGSRSRGAPRDHVGEPGKLSYVQQVGVAAWEDRQSLWLRAAVHH